MYKYGKTDDNHGNIVRVLRECGATVQSLAPIGGGAPDILCGFRGKNILMEIKRFKGELTPDQIKWHLAWKGEVTIVHSPIEATDFIYGRFQK